MRKFCGAIALCAAIIFSADCAARDDRIRCAVEVPVISGKAAFSEYISVFNFREEPERKSAVHYGARRLVIGATRERDGVGTDFLHYVGLWWQNEIARDERLYSLVGGLVGRFADVAAASYEDDGRWRPTVIAKGYMPFLRMGDRGLPFDYLSEIFTEHWGAKGGKLIDPRSFHEMHGNDASATGNGSPRGENQGWYEKPYLPLDVIRLFFRSLSHAPLLTQIFVGLVTGFFICFGSGLFLVGGEVAFGLRRNYRLLGGLLFGLGWLGLGAILWSI